MERPLELPSVAEMLKSTPRSNTIPAYHHHAALPRNGPNGTMRSPVRLPAPVEQFQPLASHASPTGSATSTSSSELQYRQQSMAQSTTQSTPLPAASVLAEAPCQDGPHVPSAVNVPREDSAVAQQPFDASSITESSSRLQSRDESHQPTSAKPSHYPTTRSHVSTDSNVFTSPFSAQQGQPSQPFAPATSQTGSSSPQRRLTAPLPSETQTTNHPRRGYNVRFVANQTPLTMPSVQRPRTSPQSLPAAVQVPRDVSRTPTPPQVGRSSPEIEPAILAIRRELKPKPKQPEETEEAFKDLERCSRCGEAWSRPIITTLSNCEQDVQNYEGFARASENLLGALKRHSDEVNVVYAKWKQRHTQCSPNGYCDRATSPVSDGHIPPTSRRAEPQPLSDQDDRPSNKRKSDALHDGNMKLRKIESESVDPAQLARAARSV